MEKRWSTSKTTITNLGYHIIWCPKYRRKVLVNGVDEDIKHLLTEKAEEHGWVIENMEVMPDHIHIFVKADPTSSVAYIVAQFKGYTSHAIRKKYPELWSRLPSLWSRSYFAASVGHISEETVKKYINDQKYKRNLLSSHE